jgi:hypothetical protein
MKTIKYINLESNGAVKINFDRVSKNIFGGYN